MKREGEICMNILKKLWCRTFQLGFRIAQPILPYREPKILNAIEEIPEKKKNAIGVRGMKLESKDYIEQVYYTVNGMEQIIK